MAVKVGKANNSKLNIPCRKCNVITAHDILSSVSEDVNSPDFDYMSQHEYQILTCRGCETVTFRHNYTDNEDMAYDEEYGDFASIDHEKLYPSRLAGRKPLDHPWSLPPQIRKIYEETLESLLSGHHILAGIGIRALLEITCKDLGANGRNLNDKIDNLVAQKQIAANSATLLHSTRLMGNIAAHEVTPLSIEDLAASFDVVENLLQTAYIVPEKARILAKKYPKPSGVVEKKSRASKKKKK